MQCLCYMIGFFYMFYGTAYGKVENDLTVDPIGYGDDSLIKVGEHKAINCKASNRNQKVEWLFPDSSVVNHIPGNRIYSQEHTFKGRTPAVVLTVTKAEVNDTGVYVCRSGDVTKEITLCIIEPSGAENTATEITTDIGRSITLSCPAKGDPEPTLEWYRNGETITDDGGSAKYRIMTKYNIQGLEGLLTITSLEAEDSGLYSCVRVQEHRNVENCSFKTTHNINLNINYAPIFEGQSETNVYGRFNQEVDIVCSAAGFPAPTYRLFKELPDNTLLEFNEKQIKYTEESNQAILTVIANLTTLEQKFKCLATNDLGSAEKYFTVLKMERPSKIDEVEIFKVSDTMVTFNASWDEIEFPITSIDAQYIQDSNSDKKRAYSKDAAWRRSKQTKCTIVEEDGMSPESGIRATLSDLETETSYWVRLRATNEAGMSPWSGPVFVSTVAEEEIETAEPSTNDEKVIVNDGTFYGIFFAGGILVVAFVCMFVMRMVK